MGLSLMKLFMAAQVGLYRLTGGRLGGSMRGFKVLLLTTFGRKSGKIRTTPLGYFVDGRNTIIIASNGGQDAHPSWYLNLKANPHVQIQIQDQLLEVEAQTAVGAERQRLWQKVVAEAPPYGVYETKTKREIPVVVLVPLA